MSMTGWIVYNPGKLTGTITKLERASLDWNGARELSSLLSRLTTPLGMVKGWRQGSFGNIVRLVKLK